MVPKEDLHKIVILEQLSDDMLDRLRPTVELLRFKEQETIFEEGDKAETFYMLKRGKVLLEKRISDKVMVSLGSIKPGYSFGWSTIFGREPFTTVAICAETSEVLAIKGETILDLLDSDHSMGFSIMQSLTRMMKNRLDRMEEQFLRAIREHPDIAALI
ncbi:MAG: Crp/Fnr family transcriptional regulator [Proteobacteria bacterium]|nr:Crp/Fnr family transcriptional regulator [Pseudomonadota bacterium]